MAGVFKMPDSWYWMSHDHVRKTLGHSPVPVNAMKLWEKMPPSCKVSKLGHYIGKYEYRAFLRVHYMVLIKAGWIELFDPRNP